MLNYFFSNLKLLNLSDKKLVFEIGFAKNSIKLESYDIRRNSMEINL